MLKNFTLLGVIISFLDSSYDSYGTSYQECVLFFDENPGTLKKAISKAISLLLHVVFNLRQFAAPTQQSRYHSLKIFYQKSFSIFCETNADGKIC